MIETDSPDIPPVEAKDFPNVPANILYNLKAASEILGVSEERIATDTSANAARMFGLSLDRRRAAGQELPETPTVESIATTSKALISREKDRDSFREGLLDKSPAPGRMPPAMITRQDPEPATAVTFGWSGPSPIRSPRLNSR